MLGKERERERERLAVLAFSGNLVGESGQSWRQLFKVSGQEKEFHLFPAPQ